MIDLTFNSLSLIDINIVVAELMLADLKWQSCRYV